VRKINADQDPVAQRKGNSIVAYLRETKSAVLFIYAEAAPPANREALINGLSDIEKVKKEGAKVQQIVAAADGQRDIAPKPQDKEQGGSKPTIKDRIFGK